MGSHRICVLGGTGFVGHHLVRRLARDGHRLRVLTRRRERHRDLLVLPGIDLVEASVLDFTGLAARLEGCDVAVNLVGILNEGRGRGFGEVHAELPARLAQACQAAGVTRLLHVSALNADPGAPSAYLRSKGQGEAAVLAAAGLHATCLRPSVIFGTDDSFFNRFAALLRFSPVLPLACPGARFAPVYVGDVVEAMARSLDDRSSVGRRYDLCGPQVFTLAELVRMTAQMCGLRRLVLGLGDGLSRLQARVMQRLPGKPFTMDNYLSMRLDSVCREDGLAALGITPTGIDAVMPRYLGGVSRAAHYSRIRVSAGRN
jgi:NADH dehydrogenase